MYLVWSPLLGLPVPKCLLSEKTVPPPPPSNPRSTKPQSTLFPLHPMSLFLQVCLVIRKQQCAPEACKKGRSSGPIPLLNPNLYYNLVSIDSSEQSGCEKPWSRSMVLKPDSILESPLETSKQKKILMSGPYLLEIPI